MDFRKNPKRIFHFGNFAEKKSIFNSFTKWKGKNPLQNSERKKYFIFMKQRLERMSEGNKMFRINRT